TLIATQDILTFLISVPASIVSVIFSFSILVIIGEKMSYIFSESKAKSKKASLIRTITMLGYFIVMFTTGFIFTLGINAVDGLFNTFSTSEPPFVLIIILSLIPFLFAPAFLVSLSTIQFQVHPILILTTLTGFALSIILAWILFKTTHRALNSAVSTEIKIEKVKKREIEFEIKSVSPIKAYIRKDLVSSTRDIQSFMFLFFPIFYPLIMFLSMIGLFKTLTFSIEVIMLIWSILLLFYLIIPIMLVVGFFNIEESGSSTLASLPISPRDQIKAKLVIMLSIQGFSLIFTSIILTLLISSFTVIILLLITLPIAWSFLLFMVVLKIKFFGQMKYKYVIEEVNKRNKPIKWIIMILSEFGLYFTILITGANLIFFFGFIISLIVIGIIGIIILSILVFIITRMFPKIEKVAEYKTGGFLRDQVNVATAVLLILYTIFLFLPGIIFSLISPLFANLPIIAINFIYFFMNVGFLVLLWQIIVPFTLKLPNGKETFREHSRSIGLSRVKPLSRNLLIGIGNIIIFGFSAILFGILLGKYYFIPETLFGGYNWLIFVFAFLPGIWEEIAFRGVILNLQLQKYKKYTVVFLNGILFGLYHFVNMLLGQEFFPTLFQIFYASFMGFSFAYMYIKTKSLLPSIILHYLLDSVGLLFQTVVFKNGVYEGLFIIFGISIIPAILMILLTSLITKRNNF
ncbi:MAG: CPBP family intramembrane glutamic endopeptidase, partial [Promethearchaeota archaeon]